MKNILVPIAFLMLFMGCQSAVNVVLKGESKEAVMKSESTYSVYYANSMRNCSIPVVSKAKGKMSWSCELGMKGEDFPIALLAWESNIVVT